MELRSVADQLWFNTAYLECHGSKGKSCGTGFFYAVTIYNPDTGKNGHLWWLITNRHVAIAANDRLDIHMIKAEEEKGQFCKPLLGKRVRLSLKNPLGEFYFHPEKDIDVAVLPSTITCVNLARQDHLQCLRQLRPSRR